MTAVRDIAAALALLAFSAGLMWWADIIAWVP